MDALLRNIEEILARLLASQEAAAAAAAAAEHSTSTPSRLLRRFRFTIIQQKSILRPWFANPSCLCRIKLS